MVPLILAIAAVVAQTPAPALVPGGTIGIARPAPVKGAPAPSPAAAEAVEGALADVGFTVIPSAANARHVATFTVTRYARGAALAKGASNNQVLPTMGAGSGAGAGVSIALGGKTNVGTMVETTMALSIARRGESTPVWEGRAVTYGVTGTRGDDPAVVSRKLATALTRNFAAPSGLLVSVP